MPGNLGFSWTLKRILAYIFLFNLQTKLVNITASIHHNIIAWIRFIYQVRKIIKSRYFMETFYFLSICLYCTMTNYYKIILRVHWQGIYRLRSWGFLCCCYFVFHFSSTKICANISLWEQENFRVHILLSNFNKRHIMFVVTWKSYIFQWP